MSQPKEIFIRLDRCMGCNSCQIACAVEHSTSKSLYSVLLEKEQPKPRLYVEWVAPNTSVPIVCRHCEDAPCMHACIAGAIRRDNDSAVRNDSSKCIGCWTCVMVCPYGVIGRHLDEQKAYRCDRCPDLDEPACVSSCPTKALVYETVDTYSALRRNTAAREFASEQKE